MVKFFKNYALSLIFFCIQSINRQPLAAKRWHRNDIVFPIVQHSDCNCPLADMLSPFYNTSMVWSCNNILLFHMKYERKNVKMQVVENYSLNYMCKNVEILNRMIAVTSNIWSEAVIYHTLQSNYDNKNTTI